MRFAAVAVVLASTVAAADAAPVRVALDCQEPGRTKACPAFLLGFVEANPLLRSVPRGAAEVIVYATVVEVAQVDRIQLRFVGALAGAPPVVEVQGELDSRGTDDAQRAQLAPLFARGIALFVAVRYPEAVTVAFAEPAAPAADPVPRSPWGIGLTLAGLGTLSKQYQNYQAEAELLVSRTLPQWRGAAAVFGSGAINRQPALVTDDGMAVSLDTEQWSLGAAIKGAYLLSPRWSVGGESEVTRDDPKGQHAAHWKTRVGVGWDRYASDDPRGNRLAVVYYGGLAVDRYHLRNVRGETAAAYPIHGAIASASVRSDKITYGVSLEATAMLLHPGRRHALSVSPSIGWKLGDHVDLDLSLSLTKRALPEPDPDEIDPSDYAQLSRLQYAEPVSGFASISITIHADRTNGARNDRFDDL